MKLLVSLHHTVSIFKAVPLRGSLGFGNGRLTRDHRQVPVSRPAELDQGETTVERPKVHD